MEELTIKEMTSLKAGGFFDEKNIARVASFGNTAVALALNTETNSNNATAFGFSHAFAGQADITQRATANSGNQDVSIFQST